MYDKMAMTKFVKTCLNYYLDNDVRIIEIINKLEPNKAIIDCPSPNIEKFKEVLKKQLKNKNVELIVVHCYNFLLLVN